MELGDPSHFINRGLSWLEFNQRVLAQALDKENPLLERLKFLCIVSSNLDEFFEVRVAGLKQQVQTHHVALAPDGMSPKSELAAISKRARKQVEDQYRCWNEEIEPGLAAQNIKFHNFRMSPMRRAPTSRSSSTNGSFRSSRPSPSTLHIPSPSFSTRA